MATKKCSNAHDASFCFEKFKEASSGGAVKCRFMNNASDFLLSVAQRVVTMISPHKSFCQPFKLEHQ